jgi:ribosomal protein L37E
MKIKAECAECGYQHSMEQDEEMMIFHITLYKCSVCGSTEITREAVESATSGLEKLKLAINGKK